jgi:hypothetical protein
MPLSI